MPLQPEARAPVPTSGAVDAAREILGPFEPDYEYEKAAAIIQQYGDACRAEATPPAADGKLALPQSEAGLREAAMALIMFVRPDGEHKSIVDNYRIKALADALSRQAPVPTSGGGDES